MMREPVNVRGVVIEGGAVLLVEHTHPPPRDERFWVFPGGAVEPGESPEAALVREMREETGLDVRVRRCLYLRLNPWGDCEAYYLLDIAGGSLTLGHDPEECAGQVLSDVRFWPLPALASLHMYPLALRDRLPSDYAAGWPDTPLDLGPCP